jgi:murein DD-endopeptidase MepM/ murein hydrolase activator NlpD
MNIHKYKLQGRHITPHLLCALTWMNAVLAVMLVVQQQQEYQHAYLMQRMPGSVQKIQKTSKVQNKVKRVTIRRRLLRTVAVESFSPITDVPVSDIHITATQSASSSLTSTTARSSRTTAAAVSSTHSSLSSEVLHNAASASASAPATGTFPAFESAMMPVGKIPNWGAMKSPKEWDRSYSQMMPSDFVPTPYYDLITLTIPVKSLEKTRDDPQTINFLTEKLFYSTRYFGAYDVDAEEFTAIHPGIDLKLADGTPVGAVAGGRVHDVRRDDTSLGLHVIIEHRAPDGKVYYSIYGHLAATSLKAGNSVEAGQTVGTVGMTGNTSGPHLHLQIDRGEADESYHSIYWPEHIPSRQEADKYEISPIRFIQLYR